MKGEGVVMDVMEAIGNRRSVRSYDGRAIPAAVEEPLLRALRYAPSACNLQPWRFVLVREASLRREVARACRDQMWMAEAPLIVVGCSFADRAYQKMGGYGNSADLDVTIALDHLTLAAASLELGTCWIGAFDEGAVKALLGIPAAVKVVALVPVGYPSTKELNHPIDEGRRKSAAEVFSVDGF